MICGESQKVEMALFNISSRENERWISVKKPDSDVESPEKSLEYAESRLLLYSQVAVN